MNRKIKFRCWDKISKKMHYLDDAYYNINNGSIEFDFPQEFFHDSRQYESNDNDFELMQFTGLHDKNGKEIYEGDIVQGERHWEQNYNSEMHYKKGIVKYLDWDAKFAAMYDEKLGVVCNYIGGPSLISEDIEIIGNIYEHPHLLEGK